MTHGGLETEGCPEALAGRPQLPQESHEAPHGVSLGPASRDSQTLQDRCRPVGVLSLAPKTPHHCPSLPQCQAGPHGASQSTGPVQAWPNHPRQQPGVAGTSGPPRPMGGRSSLGPPTTTATTDESTGLPGGGQRPSQETTPWEPPGATAQKHTAPPVKGSKMLQPGSGFEAEGRVAWAGRPWGSRSWGRGGPGTHGCPCHLGN